jgi:hypothetical protein
MSLSLAQAFRTVQKNIINISSYQLGIYDPSSNDFVVIPKCKKKNVI